MNAPPSDTSQAAPATRRLAALARIPRHGGWRTPMQSPAWLQACYEALYPNDLPRLIEVEGGLGPFARRGRVFPILLLAGAQELGEAIDPPVADVQAAERLSAAILAQRLPIRFGHIPANGPFAKAFLEAAPKRGIVLYSPAGGSPVLHLDGSWTDPLARFSSRRRADFRRMQRRAEALGEMSIQIFVPTRTEAPALLDQAFDIEALGWKSRTRTAVKQVPKQAAFFHNYGARIADEGRLRVAILRIGGQAVAMQIMVEEDNALWLLKIGHDETFAKASPGMLLMLEVVRDAASRGLDRVEFLGKAAPWTEFWAPDTRPHIRMRYYPRNLRGMVALAIDAISVNVDRVLAKRRDRKIRGTG